jgi:hypothetical protein
MIDSPRLRVWRASTASSSMTARAPTTRLIVAAGDCTARRLADGRLLRLESVQKRDRAGQIRSRCTDGTRAPVYVASPWFWSDQFDVKLQMVGLSHGYDQVVTRGDLDKPAFSAYYFREGKLIAVDSLSRVQDHMQAKRLLDAGLSCTPEQAADAQFTLQTPGQSGQAASYCCGWSMNCCPRRSSATPSRVIASTRAPSLSVSPS